jgi:hypothetical protein
VPSRHKAGIPVHVAQVQTQRRRFEQEPVFVLEHRDATERMPAPVPLAVALLARHHRQLIWSADFLERPDNS